MGLTAEDLSSSHKDTSCQTPTQKTVNMVVRDMEIAFATGSCSRVLTKMTSHVPYASDISFLESSMFNMPTLGWSCWEMSVMLTHLLSKQGINSGVTLAFGAEENAPAIPHSIVRVEDSDGNMFYSDPYFGIGSIRPNNSPQDGFQKNMDLRYGSRSYVNPQETW